MKDLLAGLQIATKRPVTRARSRAGGPTWLPRILVALALVSILSLAGSLYLVKAAPVPVDVFTVVAGAKTGGPAPVLTAGGYVRDAKVVYVAPRVAGRIASLPVTEGDAVRAGDLLAVIDSRDLEQDAGEARANYELAEAALRQLEAGARPEEIAETRARTQAAALAKERAERDVVRARTLFDSGVISSQAFDRANTEYLVSEKTLDAARQSLALVEAGARVEEIQAARAALTAARARWISASNRLRDARVLAPVAGRVLRKFRNVGDFVSPDVPFIEGYETIAVGSPVVALAESVPQEVVADINETDLARISLHQPAAVSPNAYPDDVLQGSVTQISPRADRNKNTVEVKVTLDRSVRPLPYDMSVKVRFLGQPSLPGPADPRIPWDAVVDRAGRHVVFVASDARAVLREVEIGDRQGDLVVITTGLADGDRVIVSNVDQLENGSRITLK